MHDAVCAAGIQRFRPIILTTLTTFFGLMPMIFETSRQARFLIPMAITVAYGLAFATFVTLIALPLLIAILNELRRLLYWAWNATWPVAETLEPAVKELPYENLEETRH